MSLKPFLKFIHPWISLCAFFLFQTPFSLETAKCCNGSKEGTLMSAKLLRKTTRKSFFVVSLRDDTSSDSSGLWRNLAAGFHWKEAQGFGIPLGQLRSSRFLDAHRDRITMSTLTLMWDRKNLERNPLIYSHGLACYNLFYFTLFLL